MRNSKSIILKSLRCAAIAACIACAGLVAVSVVPTEVSAQDTDKITMQFVGFGVNPDFYAIVQGSSLSGKSLVINKIGGQGPLLVYPLRGVSLEKALTSKEVAPYGIQGGYVAGMTAPAGYQLGGMVIGENLQLTLSAGDQQMTLGYAPIFSNPTKTKVAAVSIVNAFWTADSKRVVIILNQKLNGDWAVDTDMVAAFLSDINFSKNFLSISVLLLKHLFLFNWNGSNLCRANSPVFFMSFRLFRVAKYAFTARYGAAIRSLLHLTIAVRCIFTFGLRGCFP